MPSLAAIALDPASPAAAAADRAHAAIAQLGANADVLAAAAETAADVAALTADADLALAAALKIAVPAQLADERLKDVASPAVLRLARELARLGDFGVARQWSAQQGLDTRQSELLRKLLLASVADPRLVLARLAEQLVRMRRVSTLPPGDRQRLALETREILAPLANRLGVWRVKWELEDRAFRELEPAEYQRLAKALDEKRLAREDYVARTCDLLLRELSAAGIAARVYGRAKHLYSIHRKMQRKHVALEQIFDLRAVRIVVPTVADCYAALGIVHGLWSFIPGEFDDYIALPKENLYRSIHTAVTGPEGRSLEVQIRTQEMQDQAELGVAAHWMYKEGAARDAAYERRVRWVRTLLHAQDEGAAGAKDGGDLLDTVGGELFADRVYALTPRGDVVDLPHGGTPLDFAYHVHTSLGHRCRGAKVNGRIVPLTHKVATGDVVEIIAGKTASPSRDWLAPEQGYLASARSRAKLKAWFRKLDGEPDAPEGAPVTERPAPGPRRRRPAPQRSGGSPVIIEGVGDLPITLARCCSPAPPLAIAAYATLARGVTVHVRDCPGLARMRALQPERVLEAEWTPRYAAALAERLPGTAPA